MAALATPEQLGAFLRQPIDTGDLSTLLVLDIASGMVRDYLHAEIDAVAGDVVTLDPLYASALLPELPVTKVSLVETFDGTTWTTADPTTYTVSLRTGVISGLSGVSWPLGPGTWRVTYDHGYAVVPMTIVGVVLGVAARAYSSPSGIDSERVGGYQVKYSMEAEGFTGIERKALARYINPRIA